MKVLGRAEVGGHSVALPVADARQHIHMLGATGSGKSTLMANMVLDDINARRGTVVIDPHGDLVTDILDRLPATVADRLVLIDPDQDGGATFNPLDGDDPDLVVDNIVSIFSNIFAKHWGPRMDDVLRVACLTLLRHANATLPLIPPLLNDKQFRAPFTVDLDDPAGLRGFWEWYESTPPAVRAQVIGPVLSPAAGVPAPRLRPPHLRAPTSSFDMGRVLDGGILLARLPKGQLGEDDRPAHGVVRVRPGVAGRHRPRPDPRAPPPRRRRVHRRGAQLPEPGRRRSTDMLAEARGYRLSLVLAHQHLAQLPRDTRWRCPANARNKIFFTCSPEDAQQLARHTPPELRTRTWPTWPPTPPPPGWSPATGPPRRSRCAPHHRAPVGETTAIRQAVARPAAAAGRRSRNRPTWPPAAGEKPPAPDRLSRQPPSREHRPPAEPNCRSGSGCDSGRHPGDSSGAPLVASPTQNWPLLVPTALLGAHQHDQQFGQTFPYGGLSSSGGTPLTPLPRSPRSPVRSSTPTLVSVSSHLSPRDLTLAHLLDAHRVLTTDQITAMLFTSPRTCVNRLRLLRHLGFLERFRPPHRAPTTTWYWIPGPLAARYVALARDERPPTPKMLGQRQDAAMVSPQLAHLVGANQFFTDLIAHARSHPDARLTRWWSASVAAAALSRRVHPDGHGVWSDPGRGGWLVPGA